MARRATARAPLETRKSSGERMSWDTHMLDVHLTGLQAEVEAKLRHVARFREQMQRLDDAARSTSLLERKRAIGLLLRQIDEMLEGNRIVRGTLEELRDVTLGLRDDMCALQQRPSAGRRTRKRATTG